MTSVSKSAFIDRIDGIVNKYNNTYHSTIKMKPIDVKSNTYIKSSKKANDKDPKFKIGGIVTISNQKNIFANWSEKVIIKKFKSTVPFTMLLMILIAKKVLDKNQKEKRQKGRRQ